MADLTTAAPVETEKSTFLHDRGGRPEAPKRPVAELVRDNLGLLLGLVLALGFTALAFQTRASWDSHRDWVVPMTVPIWAVAGVSLGHLLARRKVDAAFTGLMLLVVVLGLTILNIWQGTQSEGQDGARDALTISAAVALGITVLALLVGAIWVEAKDPTKAPPPEM
ncbi:MAG: hypothetical protein HY875_13755 [Chloroflexi bacterium]|nr:hypothetical protein [Chloroflexota bacterium]